MPTEPDSEDCLPITVVIPVKNEVASMERLIHALLAESPPPAQVIVVDAASTDGTRECLRRLASEAPRLRLIEVDRANPGEGRNIGTEQAETEWIAYLDGGTWPHPGMLQAFAAAVRNADVDVAYGFYVPHLGTRVARWYAIVDLPAAHPVGNGLMRNHVTPSSMVRKSAWQRVGGYPPHRAAEDRIFKEALRSSPRVEVPEAVMTWIGPQTWRQVWQRTALLGEHSARAGRSRDWHIPTLRLWLLGALLMILAPAPFKWWAIALALVLRALRRIRRHRHEAVLFAHPWLDVPGVVAMFMVMDIALFWGWVKSVRTQVSVVS